MTLPEYGTRVQVHKNLLRQLHGKSDQWTIRVYIKGKGWRNACHVETCTLTNAVPIASAAGAARIRCNAKLDPTAQGRCTERKGQREVVARIEGILSDECLVADSVNTELDSVHYNPWRSDDFTYADGTTYVGSAVAYFPLIESHFLA